MNTDGCAQVGEEADGLDDDQLVPSCRSATSLLRREVTTREPSRTLRGELARLRHGEVPSETGDGGAQGVEGTARVPMGGVHIESE